MRVLGRNNRMTRAIALAAAAVALGGGGIVMAQNASAAYWSWVATFNGYSECMDRGNASYGDRAEWECAQAEDGSGRYELQVYVP